MSIVNFKKAKRVICDGCGSMPVDLSDFDEFFVGHPSGDFHPITDEPLFKWVHGSENVLPAMFNCCPSCAKSIKENVPKGNLNALPNGPLKIILKHILAKAENRFKTFIIRYKKDSRMGHA
jgi:hypothetical protein